MTSHDRELVQTEWMESRGRTCPLAYRYQPEALAEPVALSAGTLYIVGGVYGNPLAVEAVLGRAQRDPAGVGTVVFNGDFHWLDVDRVDFRAISQAVLSHHAVKGNVEAELASAEDGGCGCAYPDYVDDAVVERSNQIMTRLRGTARGFPDLVGRLDGLPRHLTVAVGAQRVGIVHGDPDSLAGWGLALEAMEPGDAAVRQQTGWRGQPTTAGRVAGWFRRAEVTVLASTHTGLPYAQDFTVDGRQRLVINNGTAGLGNFAGTTHGVITRLSRDPAPPPDSLYGISLGGLRCDALPVHFDPDGWRERFLARWPPGSPGHDAYLTRITGGTSLEVQHAMRGNVSAPA
jgi:hypothetical protein